MKTIKVLHVIKSLELGGAETVLKRLVQEASSRGVDSEIVTLTSVGPIGKQLVAESRRVTALGIEREAQYGAAVMRLAALIREVSPDVVQTWMYHGDLVGGLAARLARRPVVWGIHAGSPPPRKTLTSRAGFRLNAMLSHFVPERIICCSHTTARVHAELGFDRARMVVIPNGFEVPDPVIQTNVRGARKVVIRVGRDHPDKDIPTFIQALGELRGSGIDAEGVLVGPGLDADNQVLSALVEEAGLEDRVRFLGPRADIANLFRSADVAVSSSSGGEGLPLVIGEAMSFGTPAIVTDVGDSALILGDPLRTVPPKSPKALADAIRRVLALDENERADIGLRDRERVKSEWSLDRMVDCYYGTYRDIARGDT